MTQVQDQNIDAKTRFTTLFGVYESNLNGLKNHPLSNIRKQGFDQLLGLEFPTRRDEDWKYTSFAKILNSKLNVSPVISLDDATIDQFLFEGLDILKMVFINGHFSPSQSQLGDVTAGLQIISVKDALESKNHSDWIASQLALKGGTDNNTFLQLNQAFANDGFVIIVDKNVHVEKPIHMVHINTGLEEAHLSSPQLFIKAESGSNVTVIESFHSTSTEAEYFNNATARVDVAANAHVHHYRIQLESRAAHQVTNTFVTQERDSVYSSYGVDLGGSMVRNNLATEHEGPGITTNYFGAYLANGRQHIDNQTFIDHAVPHCDSNELYKGILADKGRGVFNGKVLVRRDAQKTNAFQQNNSLILDDTAVMDAKPQLEIYADDVKCSHGATIGQMDESSVFYLRSRGIPKDQALTLLQQAFVGEAIDKMKIDQIRDKIYQLIEEKLSIKVT